MEAKILNLISRLQTILLPWCDEETPEKDWYYTADDMAELLPDFLRWAKHDYAMHITPPLIKELHKWLSIILINTPTDANHQFTDWEINLRGEVTVWLQWIHDYYPDTVPSTEVEEPATMLPECHPLTTPEVIAIFEKLAEHGFMKSDGDKWQWQETKALYGYFVEKLSYKLHLLFKDRINWQLFNDVITNGKKLEKGAKESNARFTNSRDGVEARGCKYEIVNTIISN
jgi:hypothetical protein